MDLPLFHSKSLNANPCPPHARRLLHWNIKELDSEKLVSAEHPQVTAAAGIIRALAPDLLSINELHCDPERDNLAAFVQLFDAKSHLCHQRLSPSNTGMRSEFLKKTVDRSNFGLFPGQYATGFASCFPLQKTLEIQKLLWREWEPDFDRSPYHFGAAGPDDIELFDKSFTVHWLDFAGRSLAVVCLHAVPAFHFGQDKSPNAERNRAQLEFLRWFLTSESQAPDRVVRSLAEQGITPLAPNQAFIAVGDFNSPLNDKRYPGGAVTQSLLEHPRLHNRSAQIPADVLKNVAGLASNVTFFAEGWDYQKLPTQLDYILVSRDIRIHNLQVIMIVPDRQIHGFFEPTADSSERLKSFEQSNREVALKRTKTFGPVDQQAIVSVQRDYARLRASSDHLPLILDFSWA